MDAMGSGKNSNRGDKVERGDRGSGRVGLEGRRSRKW